MSNMIRVCHSFNSCMHSTSKFSTRRVCLTNLGFLVDVVFVLFCFFFFFGRLVWKKIFPNFVFGKIRHPSLYQRVFAYFSKQPASRKTPKRKSALA